MKKRKGIFIMYAITHMRTFISDTYYSRQPMNEADFKRARSLFVLEGSMANGVLALTSGAFLSGYASMMGADDSLNGIIGAIPTLLCVVQLFSTVVLENLREKKFIIAFLALMHRLLLTLIFFVPLFVREPAFRLAAVVGIFAAAHGCGAFIGTGAGNWLRNLVPGRELGSYLGKRDAKALAFTTIVSLSMGKLLDWFRGQNAEQAGFLTIGLAVLAMTFVDFYCFSSAKEPVAEESKEPTRLKHVFTEPLKNKGFRKIIGFYGFWNLGLQIAAPFFSVYMVTGLNLDYTYMTFLGLIASLSRVFASGIWGRLADRKSWLWVTKTSMLLLGCVHISWFFMTKETCLVLQPILQSLSGIAWGGIAISVFNVQYQYAPDNKQMLFVGANSAYAGMIGFASSLLGAALLTILPSGSLFGMAVNGMQFLFVLSGSLIIGCSCYVHFILKKI
ncbi:MFS transporter [uncultured Robinsoniella sp.]|uniref:MFS transporter n=1 Tax=Robinsoniella sp. TaxID=2496533 RepID=UPI00374E9C6F